MTVQVDPVRKEVVVETSPERAFRVFTQSRSWWPASHHIGKTDFTDLVMEPRPGGRWFEVGTDGAECDWGKVLVWDPPKRLVLAWQLNDQWAYDPSLHTEVEVRFIPLDAGKTRVELEHRNLEAFGEKAAEMRSGVDSPGGWSAILEQFAAEAGRSAPSAP